MAFATLRAGVSVRPAATPRPRTLAPRRDARRDEASSTRWSRGASPECPARRRRSRRATRRRRVSPRGSPGVQRPPRWQRHLAPADPRRIRLSRRHSPPSILARRAFAPRPSPDLAPLAPHPARRQTRRVAPPDGGFSAETTDDVVAPPSLAGRPGAPSTSPTPKRLSTVRSPLPRRKPPTGKAAAAAAPAPSGSASGERKVGPRRAGTCETSYRAR